MTLGARPEWLALGYLRNQRLLARVDQIDSVTVDWDVNAAAVRTRSGHVPDLAERTAHGRHATASGQRAPSWVSHLAQGADACLSNSEATDARSDGPRPRPCWPS